MVEYHDDLVVSVRCRQKEVELGIINIHENDVALGRNNNRIFMMI